MKNKHNKRKNTMFLFEILVREISDCLYKKDLERANVAKKIMKQYFAKGTLLEKELQLFEAILSSVGMSSEDAFSILMETKRQHEQLSNEEIANEQLVLAGKIKKYLGKNVFENFVPNFKMIATINQIFSKHVPIKQKILLEKQITAFMTNQPVEKTVLEPIDNIVMKSFMKKFNEKYQTLGENQKTLLKKYASCFQKNDPDLLVFLEKEVGFIKQKIGNAIKEHATISKDEFLKERLNRVLDELEKFKKKQPDESMIKKVLKAQNILKEIEQ